MPTTKSITICYNDQTRTLSEWADHLNLHYPTLYARYTRGLPPSRIFAASPKTIATQLITYRGQTMQLRHWADELGLPYPMLRMRYKRGHRGAELLRPKRVQIADRPRHRI